MKKFAILLAVLFTGILAFQSVDAQAQYKTREDLMKERKDMMKRIKEKPMKEARKEAKRLEKEEGWTIFPGERPLAKMLQESWMKMETKKFDPSTGDELDAYIWATGNAVASNKTAAKMQALNMAMTEIASKLDSKVASLVSANIANAQLSSVEAESIAEVVQSAKTMTAARLKNVKPVVSLMRTAIPKKGLKKYSKSERKARQIRPGMVEVQLTLFYDLYQADIQVREAMKKDLKDKLKDNENDLKKLMGL